MTTLVPRQPVPDLTVETLKGVWQLINSTPEHFTMVVFYRGWHCPICGPYLRDLDRKLPEFSQRGVEVIAISSDGVTRAQTAKDGWKIKDLTLGYGMSIEQGAWGME